MGNFFHSVFQTFFLIGYLLLFVVTLLILRPFRYNRQRMKSTIALKVSYLLFLAVFLVFTYLLLFGKKEPPDADSLYAGLFNVHFLFFLSSLLIPNIGIMARRRVKKKRKEYNLIFTLINLIYFIYLMFLCVTRKWAIM